MADTETKQTRLTPRWVKIVLGLSLALNLLIIGAVAGSAMRMSKASGGDRTRGGIAYVIALERDDRRAILGQLKSESQAARKSGRAQNEEVLKVLRGEEFDAAALDGAMQGQIKRNQLFQERVRAELLARIGDMSLEERRAYADRLEHHFKRGPRKGKRKNAEK